MILRVLPQRPVNCSHVHLQFLRELSAVDNIFPPEVEGVQGRFIETPRPKSATIQDRITLNMGNMKKDRRCRPVHPMKASKDFNSQTFNSRGQCYARYLRDFLGCVLATSRLTAKRLPLADCEKTLVAKLTSLSGLLPNQHHLRLVVLLIAIRKLLFVFLDQCMDFCWSKTKLPFSHDSVSFPTGV